MGSLFSTSNICKSIISDISFSVVLEILPLILVPVPFYVVG